MLTSYWVNCPHAGCKWSGTLLPLSDTQLFRFAAPTVKTIVFQCPQCERQWRARIVGDDAVPLPPTSEAAEEKVAPWA
jgi:hypothetical protein